MRTAAAISDLSITVLCCAGQKLDYKIPSKDSGFPAALFCTFKFSGSGTGDVRDVLYAFRTDKE